MAGGNGPDKQKESTAQSGLSSIFNYGLPAAQQNQTTGTTTLSQANSSLAPASEYFNRLLTGGRTDYTQLSAPAINSTLAGADAARNSTAQFGSGRSGASVSSQRDAGANTEKQINDTINQNTVAGRAAGAQGVSQVAGEKAAIGSTELQNALGLLGVAGSSEGAVLSSAQADRADTAKAQAQLWGTVIQGLL